MPVVTPAIAAVAGAPLLLAGWSQVTVRDGDTLWDIASAHRTDVGTLARANHLADGGHLLHPGQVLRVPAAKGTAQHARAARAAAERRATSAARTTAYRVRSGDTISDIALRLRVSPAPCCG
ncbi:hypothetical protein GCM10025868_43720 [Angustibacter aerolatus]|uniref:LysM domain-containing protein n=1 Tax=Angustibacter aerolatus TaxID=1162965 RepID=A0ABQ6JMW7_9ACTN|nr:LysM peptidoglycan-binding domain-containing protein [Angustibacter aerolatus]GMA89122.1 hypothetical protein GCM10025868_43720 [Angustibacter aerolatus]